MTKNFYFFTELENKSFASTAPSKFLFKILDKQMIIEIKSKDSNNKLTLFFSFFYLSDNQLAFSILFWTDQWNGKKMNLKL